MPSSNWARIVSQSSFPGGSFLLSQKQPNGVKKRSQRISLGRRRVTKTDQPGLKAARQWLLNRRFLTPSSYTAGTKPSLSALASPTGDLSSVLMVGSPWGMATLHD